MSSSLVTGGHGFVGSHVAEHLLRSGHDVVVLGDRSDGFGDGCQVRAFTHIGDVAPLIAQSVNYPSARNQVFNIGADQPYTVNEFGNDCCQSDGKKVSYRPSGSTK